MNIKPLTFIYNTCIKYNKNSISECSIRVFVCLGGFQNQKQTKQMIQFFSFIFLRFSRFHSIMFHFFRSALIKCEQQQLNLKVLTYKTLNPNKHISTQDVFRHKIVSHLRSTEILEIDYVAYIPTRGRNKLRSYN